MTIQKLPFTFVTYFFLSFSYQTVNKESIMNTQLLKQIEIARKESLGLGISTKLFPTQI